MFPARAILEHIKKLNLDEADSSLLAAKVADEMWPEIRHQIEEEFVSYGKSKHGRRIMEQAFVAYERKCFDLIAPPVFSCVETVARELMKSSTERSGTRNGKCGKPVQWLIDAIGEMTPQELGGIENLETYNYLCEDAYGPIWSDEDVKRTKFPNRHAHIHGRVHQNDNVNALNILLLGHFIFCAAGAIERSFDSKSD